MARNKAGSGRVWAGWVLFGASMLIILGAMNIAQGTIALINDKWVVVDQRDLVVVDLTGWAWALVSFGIILGLTGAGLFTGQTWARVTAIVAIGLHAMAQVLWFGANPLWGLLMITLDTVVLLALTAKWPNAHDQLDPYAEVREVPARGGTSAGAETPARAPAHH